MFKYIIIIIYEVPTPGRAEKKNDAKNKKSCQKNKRAEKKKSCRKKRVVPEKTDVVKKKLDEKN